MGLCTSVINENCIFLSVGGRSVSRLILIISTLFKPTREHVDWSSHRLTVFRKANPILISYASNASVCTRSTRNSRRMHLFAPKC